MTIEKYYAVIIDDRHSDVGVEVFEDKNDAIGWAEKWIRDMAKLYPRQIQGFVESTAQMVGRDGTVYGSMPNDWHYQCVYGEEDSLRVQEVPFHSRSQSGGLVGLAMEKAGSAG